MLEKLLAYCRTRRFVARTEIISPGDNADKLYYLISGSLTICIENEQGKEIILAYVNAGEFIGEICYFIPMEKRNVIVRTRTESHLAEISYVELNRLFENELAEQRYPILMMFGEHLSRRLLKTSRKVGDLAFLDVTGRIAATLQSLCK